MKYFEIKFNFSIDIISNEELYNKFNKIDNLLNIHLNNDLNPFVKQNKSIFEFIDVSNKNKNEIQHTENSFFKFTFKEIINVPLYKFLVLKNNDELIILANIYSLIFDYVPTTVLNDLLNIFDNIKHIKKINDEVFNTEYNKNAEEFFDLMLVDKNEVNELLPSVNVNEDENVFEHVLNIDDGKLSLFLQNQSVSYNQFFCSVFAYTLSRFTGSTKVLFNLIERDIDFIDLSNSFEPINRILPLLIDCSNQSIDSFLEYSSNLINSIMEYKSYPYDFFKERYDLNQKISFQYAPNLTNISKNNLYSDNSHDFSFLIHNIGGNQFSIKISYSDKYCRNIIKHFIDSYNLIIDDIIRVNKLSEINYTVEDDLKLLDKYNRNEHPLKYEDILDAFNDNLFKCPDNKLVSFNNVSYSYGEGAFIANKIANCLKDIGVKSGDCVSFLVERSEFYMFNILAIMSIGAVFVPLDTNHPDERIRFMLNDTKSKVVIGSDETHERLKNLNADCVILNVSDIIKEDETESLDYLDVCHNNLACILYTSGTTGVPKGVKITRKAVLNLATFYVDTYDLTNDGVYALYSPIVFDAGPQAIFQSIYAGACMSIIPEEIRLDMYSLNEYIIEQNITHTFIPTQVAKLFVENVYDTTLKVLSVGGEKLGDIDDPENYVVVDEFGPTEAFAFITSIHNLNKIDSTSMGMLNYNSKAYILDDEFRRVPCGAVGELYLSGYQIAYGYLNRDEENLKAFIENPFEGEEDYNVLYRSGDMVRLLPDGSLGLVGRHDNQVKIRGNRVELSEVESIIRELDYIDDVTVQTIKNNENNELVAYVVSGVVNVEDKICNHVADNKPDFMVPSFVVYLDEIPLTVNGKVDIKALPEVDLSKLRADYVAANTEIEKDIIMAFEKVFNQENISLFDDFVRLGGDSIKAIRIISILGKNNISTTTQNILNYKTPYLIAQNTKKITRFSHDPTDGEIDLLPIQKFFFNEINADEFSQEFVLKSKTDLNLNVLQSAFDELVNIHDMLRARFKVDEDEVIQEILPLNTRVCEIKEYSTDELNITIEKIIKDSKKSLDIGSELIKISLIHYEDDCYVVFVIQHLIVDGVSWSIIFDDLTQIYMDLIENKEVNLLRPYPYKNWIEDVKYLVENITDDEKRHWMEINQSLDDFKIKGKSKRFVFDVDTSFDVDNYLMLSEDEYLALSIARAYKKTYDEDIIFNKESHGRDESIADVDRTFGWFTSQFPVPVSVNVGYDDISLINDVYALKNAFNNVKYLGMNYQSLIYTLRELSYKHCPVTYNFLSTEFSFDNELFETINMNFSSDDEIEIDSDSFGIYFKILRINSYYRFNCEYGQDTYLSDKFNEFIENIKSELEFIGNYHSNNIICCLSEAQLGVYLDEKVNDKCTAYSTPGLFECKFDKTVDEIKDAIHTLIDKHPILKGRIVDSYDLPLLVCDSYPSIEVTDTDDFTNLIKPYDLNESLASFYIIDNDDGKFIFYDIHHVISDATSYNVVNKDLEAIFDGAHEDTIDLGFYYSSRDSFESKFENIYDEAHEFYCQNLSNIENVGVLFTDIEGYDNIIELPIRGIRNKIRKFCQKLGITENGLFNAVFAYSLSRFVGNDNVYYTLNVHGRQESYSQNAVGMFVQTIPIFINCKDASIKEFLSDVYNCILDSMKYSTYPFRLLASEFNLKNDVSFEYNTDIKDMSYVGDDLIIKDMDRTLVSDFACAVNDLNDGYLVSMVSGNQYSNKTIIRFLNTFKEILIQITENNFLSEIEYVSSSDMELLDSINKTEHDLNYADILDAFNANLVKYPNNKLVSFNNASYSYCEGAFVAGKIANSLIDFGVKSGDCISFLVERSEFYMFNILAIMSIGGVFVPLDTNLPDERINFILKDTKSKILIVSDETYQQAKNLNVDCTILNVSDITSREIGSLNHLDVSYNDLACILYTSGTTGVPKGVKITRKAVLNLSEFYADTYFFTKDSVYGLFASISFDASYEGIFVPIYTGASLSIIPEDIKVDMIKLNDYFIQQNITHTFITTKVGKIFMQTIDNTSLKLLSVGGEKLGRFENPKDYYLMDGFGPTEAFDFISSINCEDKINPFSIGFLNYNTKAYILDNEYRRVPYGAVGELYLAGYQIADGYLNRDEENAKAFIENPFEDDDYAVLYRTGDMVRLLPDGSLGLVGRRDSQVKIRGNRVELSEIEVTIRELDFVDDVTVQVMKNENNDELIAYVILNEVNDNFENDICEYISTKKPDYMVPYFVMSIDKIPLTITGKVDKKALPKVDFDNLQEEYVAPTSKVERDIVDAFENVFNQKIGIYDDFVRLGGDSLTAIKLLTYLGDYNISAGKILSLRTPKTIADNIEANTFDLNVYSLDSGCPLNEPQLNIYLDIKTNNKTDSYIMPVTMRISKKYGVDSLTGALSEMFKVHPILKMCVSDDFDVPYLINANKKDIVVKSVADDDFIHEFFTKSFDLNNNLCRFLIVENKSDYSLFAVFHHLIFDALSYDVFKSDLLTILDGGFIEKDTSFLEITAYNQQIQETEEFEHAHDFYDSILCDTDDVGVLLHDSSGDIQGICTLDLKFDKSSFKEFLNNSNINENILFTGTFAYTLSRFIGTNKVQFNVTENGRSNFNNFNSIGMFVNTLPIVVDCKNRNITSFMDYMSDLIYDVMKFNYYPFRLLANEYDINSNIIFQYMPDWFEEDDDAFIYEDMLENMNDLINDFTFQIIQKDEGYTLSIVYSDKYSKNMVDSFAKSYELILSQIINVNELSDIKYCSNDDLKFLNSINETEHDLNYADILDAFNDNLKKYPDNKLVSFHDISYTYTEGAFIANKISDRLKDLGVESGDYIPFLVERSHHYMFSVLATMSIGAVFVPLDTNHPDERIIFILKDTESKLLMVSDETYERAENLNTDCVIFNMTDIINEKEIGSLDYLDISYNNLACILYTSGTTGVPKGVKITRKSVLNLAAYYADKYYLTNSSVYALYSAIVFDAGPQAIFQSIYAGACLSIIPEDIRFDIYTLNEYIIEQNITHTFIPTQVAKLFIENIKFTSLRILSVGGEKLGDIDDPINYVVVDEFGPTEAFAFITSTLNLNKFDSSSVGMLNYNSKVYILDDELRRVPCGAIGELYFAGYQIADGYLNRDEENTKAFISNPFDDCEDYNVLYRSGDIARLLPDGSLSLVGRRDSQVKIRGNRVELSEVESIIRELEYIDDVIVQSIKNNGNNELVAYVVSRQDDVDDVIYSYVADNKPNYMVPSFVVYLDEIPLTVNGKVDTKALPEIDFGILHADYAEANTETEKIIVRAFENVFDQKSISLYDDFVRLGGDSIKAIRIISILAKNGISATAEEILNYKTPYLIAQNVENITRTSYEPTVGEVDLLPIQKYFFDQININEFSQEFILRSIVNLDLDTLQCAFDELSNVHDMLRARYKVEGNEVIQEILPLNTRVCEVKEYVTDNLNTTIENIIKKHSLDIENNLIKIALVKSGGQSYVILIIHHLIIDGVSWSILIDDLTQIYINLIKNKETNLLRPYPYKNWVEDVKLLAENISDDEKQHWAEINEMLDDSLIEGNSKVFAFRSDQCFDTNNSLMLSEEESLALCIARAYKKTYNKDIIFNRESYGRDESLADVSRTVGWFTSQFPVFVDVSRGYDDISLMNDVYNIKNAFNNIKYLGLNYQSLIYTLDELSYKHCPVTLNFLSTEFVFKNELFRSLNHYLSSNNIIDFPVLESTSKGISLNVSRVNDNYVFNGDYAEDTYIGDKFNEFVENIKSELKFIVNYNPDYIICALSEFQLGIYLDEKINDKGTAYSVSGRVKCDNSIDEIKKAIYTLIDKHPILKGRIIDGDTPLLVCDSYPSVEIVNVDDYSKLIKPFDLSQTLVRFYIVENSEGRFVLYDMHHIISDATSHNIMNKELSLALDGELDGDVDLGFVNASHDSFNSKFKHDYVEAHEFFRDNLFDMDDVGVLLKDGNGSKNSISLSVHNIRAKIEKFVYDNNITVANLLNAVFAYTFSRFCGSEKVYYNFTEHGRYEQYSQNALGMYVRTIPVIIDCEDKSISDYVTEVSRLILNSMEYSDYPFRSLAREFNLNNDVLFEYNFDLNDVSNITDDFVIENLEIDLVSDFLCVVNDLDDGYMISVESCDQYSNETVIRFLNVFKEVLTQIVDKKVLSDIDYISQSDLELLESYNQTEHSLKYRGIMDAFNNNLSKYPDNILTISDDVKYTYSQSAYLINQINTLIDESNLDANDKIAVLVDRNHWVILSALSCLSQGITYIPIDENHPDKRIAFMIEQSMSKAVITTDIFLNRVNMLNNEFELDLYVINVSSLEEDVKSSSHVSYVDESVNEVACILYTSGTTGNPKAVQMTRLGILNLIEFYINSVNFTCDDVQGIFASVGFDVSLEQFASIFTGGSVIYVPNNIRLNINKLNDYFIKHGVTHTLITTQIAKLFVKTIENTSLKYLQTAGEKLGSIISPANYILSDVYGPTESNYVTSIDVDKKIDESSVGFLNWNTKVYILDKEQRRVPLGAVGEIYLSGYQTTNGYFNADEENRNTLFKNPFDDETMHYEYMYKTGDLGRVLPDGSIGILGRVDSQVKIRGNRVELTEIEVTIKNMNHVNDVTVQTISSDGNDELVAYVVMSDDFNGNFVDYVKNYVHDNKPDYMIPSFVIKLDEIPLNVNGKVDKRALANIDYESLRVEYVSPTTENEKIISDAFEQVFNQKYIGLYDDFIQLGGDSIKAIRVITLLEKNGISCAARDILNYKTPYLIAQNIEKISKISYDATEGEINLLPIQMYFFEHINSNRFTQEFILKSKVDLDLNTLQSAFDKLSNVHDMLRAIFRHDCDKIIQEILPADTRVCEIDECRIDDINHIAKIIKKLRFSIDIGSELVKITLVHHNDECILVFVIHHLIVDGVSWSILIDDLTYILTQMKENNEVDLLRPYPFKNWVKDVELLVDEISEDEKRHWVEITNVLDDSLIKGKIRGYTFDVDMLFDVNNLLMLSEEEYLALSIARAYKQTYGEDIIFKKESYGRDENLSDVRRTFGWFTSQFPVSVKVENGHDIISLMNDVYSIKNAFKDIKNLGLNYGSLIYTTNEIEYNHCPVTFNFLSTEFSFENEMFEAINMESVSNDEIDIMDVDSDSFGINLNVFNIDDCYIFNGDYADNTYLGDKFDEFVDNIRSEMEFIATYDLDSIVCCLSESQLGIYLDEKVHDRGSAYSVFEIFECDLDKSVDEIENAIHAVIEKHPIMKGRIIDCDIPLLVCDNYPSIETVKNKEYSELIKPFDLNESLTRFYIVDNDNSKFIFYDMHHIISDANSRNIINNNLSLALNGKLDNKVDLGFLHSSNDSFNLKYEKIYNDAYEFFKNKLSTAKDVGVLLGDGMGFNNNITISVPNIRDEVKAFCSKSGITVSNFFNAAFAYTLSRFTGDDEVYYNFTEHGRHESYNQEAVGMFVRTIPLMVNCGNSSVKDYLSQVSNLILDSMKYSVYPFRLLASEFELHNDIIFEYNYDLNDVSDIEDDLIIEDSHGLISDFSCIVNDLNDGYSITIESSNNYSNELIIRFLNAFKEILIQMLNKNSMIDINYTSSSDLELLDSYNKTEHSLKYEDILDAFNDNLKRYPNNKFVSYKDKSYSYGEGAFIADKIAKKLSEVGVNPQDSVSVFVNRSELYLLNALAIMSVGAIYVPLDDAHPNERIQFMLNDTQSNIIIVSDETVDRAKSLAPDSIILNVSEIIDEDVGLLNSLDIVYDDFACILYTSGTTGIPKGVKITRKAIVNLATNYQDKFNLTNEDVYCLFSTIGFDAALLAISVVLYSGACLSIIPMDIRLNIEKVNEYFIENNITHTLITTQVGKLFMEEIENTSLKVLLVGGEKLGEFKSPEKYTLVDAFGPTETCVFISSIKNSDKIDYSSIGSLGYNTKAYILDNNSKRVPIGAVGELYLAGYQVSDGYLNREEENRKSFIDNPFENNDEYAVMYRSGDMVKILSDGTLGFIGRRDGQVKIRGNRVELSEVESIIRELNYIEDVTVQTVQNRNNNELIAYVVISKQSDDTLLKNDICDYVSTSKPEYMVPSYVIRVDKIPLNINGKVNKHDLPKVDLDSLREEYVAPTTQIQKSIVNSFEKVFNIEKISIHDDFVKLGGDSLTAIKIKSATTIDLDIKSILNFRTPYEIAQHIDDNNYGFELIKKGTKNQNMFLIPDIAGLSFVFSDLINSIDFEGNIYTIDDFKHDLTIEDIKKINDNEITLNHYYDAIIGLFNDGDIIVGYSLGCIYASLIAEKLEKDKLVGDCILIDGSLNFVQNEKASREDMVGLLDEDYSYEFKEKMMEIFLANSVWNFHIPRIASHITFLCASDLLEDDLKRISDNYEFINIDSTHKYIISKDVGKIAKYFKK